jgi:hypothetical protein
VGLLSAPVHGNLAAAETGRELGSLIAFGGRTLCRGTYRASASVSGIEPIGAKAGRTIDAKPFGSVTFTVR